MIILRYCCGGKLKWFLSRLYASFVLNDKRKPFIEWRYMSLTKFDSNFYRGKQVVPTMSSYVAFNVGCQPGRLVMAGSVASQANLGGQIAAKLCLEHLSESILDCYEKIDSDEGVEEGNILERSLKNANIAVYNFGHQLAAGGRLASSLLVLVIENERIISGRVGSMGAYLYRKGNIYPFFVNKECTDTCIGVNSKVLVETAEVEAQPYDSVFLFSKLLSESQEQLLARSLGGIQGRVDFDLDKIVKNIFPDSDNVEFAQVVCIGPKTLFLGDYI